MAVESNSIYQIDCLEGMALIGDGTVDMILCDLPYGTTDCAWDSVIPFEPLWAQYKRVIKPDGAIVLTASQPFTSALVGSNLKWFKYSWVWIKTNCTGFANAKKQPLRSYEDVVVFYRQQPTYNPQGVTRLKTAKVRTATTGDIMRSTFKNGYEQEFTNYPKNVLHFASERPTIHPTQKPVGLFEYLIRTYTHPGELVLDNCIGSGTTAVACINTDRRYIGFEKNAEYFRAAQDRIHKHEAERVQRARLDGLLSDSSAA